MTDVALALLFIFVGIFIQWFWTWRIAVPTCRSCQEKASPHISQALIRARHEADSADDVAKRWYDAAYPYATPEALKAGLSCKPQKGQQ